MGAAGATGANGAAGGAPAAADHLVLEAVRPSLVEAAMDAALGLGSDDDGGEAAVQLRDAMGTLVIAVENACLVGDGDVVTACMPVVERLLPAGAAGPGSVPTLLERLVPDLARHSPLSAELAEQALRGARRS